MPADGGDDTGSDPLDIHRPLQPDLQRRVASDQASNVGQS